MYEGLRVCRVEELLESDSWFSHQVAETRNPKNGLYLSNYKKRVFVGVPLICVPRAACCVPRAKFHARHPLICVPPPNLRAKL